MHARVSFYDVGGASRDDATRSFERVMEPLEQMEGNQGALMLVSEDGTKAMTITFWESADALHASADRASQQRQEAAGRAGMTIRDVEAYEVTLQFGR